MKTLEELQQDNVKLQERLNNAAKFFREQKAQIEALTSEVKEKTSLAMDYRNQINDLTKENEELKRTPQEEVIDTEKWNALVTEKEDLNKQLNDYELKLQNLEIKIDELKEKSENFETVAANKQKVIEKLENDIDSKDKAYKVLQDTYNEVYAEKEKITKQFKEQEKFESEIINTKVPELETKLKNSEAAYSELRKTYEEYLVNNKEKDNKIQVQETQIKEFTEQIKEQDKKIKNLETINDTINKQLDDEENHRLAIENDYNDLVERVNIVDENTCKFNKKDINEFCDNMLDFFKNHQL